MSASAVLLLITPTVLSLVVGHDRQPRAFGTRSPLPVAYDGGRTPTGNHAIVDEGAGEAEDGAMLLVRMQLPQAVEGHMWSELLIDAGALYVILSDGGRGTDAEEPIFQYHPPGSSMVESAEATQGHLTPVWSNSSLEVGFAPDVDVEATLLLAAAVTGQPPPRFEIEALGQRDWVSHVQSTWPPVELAGCLRIVFPWHERDETHPLPTLMLQPGMAFGTGEHATTQLCCRAVHELMVGRMKGIGEMLDYGSGSGIIAFAALLFGCERAVGVEIDPYALRVSRSNAADNGMDERFVAMLPHEEEALAPDRVYPLVVANILARTLVQLEPTLSPRVAPGGLLLLSGIWGEAQVAAVTKAYSAEFEAFETSWQNGWALVAATRKAAALT